MFSALLSYVDKPWKVFGVIFLAVIGVVTYTIYEQRTTIAEAILRRYQEPHLLPAAYTAIAPTLLAESKADVTQLLQTDLEKNLLQAVSGYDKQGAVWLPNTSPHPLITERTDPKMILAIIQSQPKCLDITAEMPVLHAEYLHGVRRVCAIGVPPVVGIVSGLLYVGWINRPDAADEDSAKESLITAAPKVAVW
jgi:hypothetical protein